MKRRYLILVFIIFVSYVNSARAVDYFPELGIDPFYSSLNPMYENKEQFVEQEDSLIDILKKKKLEKMAKREQEKEKKKQEKEQKKKEKELKKEKRQQEKLLAEKQKLLDKQKEERDALKEIFGDDIIFDDENELTDDSFVTVPKRKMSRSELEKELMKEEREKEKALQIQSDSNQSFRDFFPFLKKKEITSTSKEDQSKEPNMEISADFMEYFPDRYEVEALGNAKVHFKAQNTTLTANKIVFNYDRNILKANENVVLINSSTTTEGDFIKIDLSRPNGWIENPNTITEDISLSAKEAFIYSDKIVEYDGVAKILKDEVVSLGAKSFAGYVDNGNVLQQTDIPSKKTYKGIYKLKANKIIIDSKDEHDVITLKNSDLLLKNRKIAVIPSLTIVSNKEHSNVETNLPELGSQKMLGMHIGPAVVLNVPGGSTLKLAPIMTYKDDKFGYGGIARFRNEHNMTEIAYGTSEENFLLRGRHKIAPGLKLDYSRLTNQSEWFMGYRMPKYSAQLSYSKFSNIKDLKLTFSQLYSAGIFVDRYGKTDFKDAEGRFRWMTQTVKPIYAYKNEEGNIGVNVSLIAQTAATLYTTGDTLGMVRFGPSLATKLGPWNQSIMYLQTGQAGESPFYFDRYRYGRSNVVFLENIKICKYLSIGYLASLAINSDIKEDDTLQENRLFLSIGPEYAKVIIGYDARRRNTAFRFSMLVGTKDSDLEFKEAELKNPKKVGSGNKKKSKKPKKDYKQYLMDKTDV